MTGTTSIFADEAYNETGTGTMSEWEWVDGQPFPESSTVRLGNSYGLEMKEHAASLETS